MTLDRLDPGGLLFCLDFDGTLVEIADRPDGIHVPDDLAGDLNALRDRVDGRLAIVTGREVSAIEAFLPGYDGDIFGAHGTEARRDGRLATHPLVGSPVVAQVQGRAQALCDTHPSLLLEPKKTGVVVHYRADPSREDQVIRALTEATADLPDLVLHHSKMAIEVRPADATKGRAVTELMADAPAGIRPLVAGDDTTDEEAMEVAETMDGVTIRVGGGETRAAHRVDGPQSMRALVRRWAGMAR